MYVYFFYFFFKVFAIVDFFQSANKKFSIAGNEVFEEFHQKGGNREKEKYSFG